MSNDADRLRDAIQFVTLGYGDMTPDSRFWSEHFRTAILPTELTQELVQLVPTFNAFEGGKVAKALERFKGKVSGYQFGREGSPILYIHLPYWTNQFERVDPHTEGTRIAESEHLALLEQMRSVFIDECAADEFELDRSGHIAHVWWD